MVSETKPHNMSIVLTKLKWRYPIGKLIELHLEEINGELAIDVSELVFVSFGLG